MRVIKPFFEIIFSPFVLWIVLTTGKDPADVYKELFSR